MRGAVAALVRITAFVRKEVAEVVRQPRLLVTLVIAPFLILLLFGAGLREFDPPLRTMFVAPDDSQIAGEVAEFAERQEYRLTVEGVTRDEEDALRRLRRGQLQLVVVFPEEVEESVRNNQQATVTLYHNQIDPVEQQAIALFMDSAVAELNRQVLARFVEEGQAQIGFAAPELEQVDPEIVVEPFVGEARQIEVQDVGYDDFYAPAVVVVLLQHLLLTLVALSLVRESQLGTNDLFRVSPVRFGEIVLGKYLAHMLFAAVVALLLIVGLVFVLGVPMNGRWADLAVVLGATLLTSAGVGFLVALGARSDSQAVQYAMMVLLATVFFSGFLLSIDRFIPAVRWVVWLVPATYGVELLRDVMLRGALGEPLLLVALLAIGLALAVVSWLGLRRRMLQA